MSRTNNEPLTAYGMAKAMHRLGQLERELTRFAARFEQLSPMGAFLALGAAELLRRVRKHAALVNSYFWLKVEKDDSLKPPPAERMNA